MPYENLSVLSGGAIGADQVWGEHIIKAGGNLKHIIFPGYQSKLPNEYLKIIPFEELELYEPLVKEAAERLKKNLPNNRFVKNLLLRSAYVVNHVKTLYAISNDTEEFLSGGTGWTIMMWQIVQNYLKHTNGSYLQNELWVASQNNNYTKWHRWNPDLGWTNQNALPALASGNCGMVGTRDINKYGIKLIHHFIMRTIFDIVEDPQLQQIIYVPDYEMDGHKIKGGFTKIDKIVSGNYKGEPMRWIFTNKFYSPQLCEWRWDGSDGLKEKQIEYMITYGTNEAKQL